MNTMNSGFDDMVVKFPSYMEMKTESTSTIKAMDKIMTERTIFSLFDCNTISISSGSLSLKAR